MARRRVSFRVLGIAQPKGSTRAFVPKGWTRPIITSDNPKGKDWQHRVAEQAQTVAGDGPFLGAVVLTVTFRLPRPLSLPKRIRTHTKKPDLDKLVRLLSDALTGVLYRDDAQIIDLHARKEYADLTEASSALITLEEADEQRLAPPAAVPLFASEMQPS